MLADVYRTAKDEWRDFTGRDLEVLFKVSFETAKAAANIAERMGHVDVANAILEKAMHP
jgi:HD-like signal output (HDOD) protein